MATNNAINTTGGALQTYTPVITLVGGAGNTVPQYTTLTGMYVTTGKITTVWINATGDGGNEGAGTGIMSVSLPLQATATAMQAAPIGYAFNNVTDSIIFGQVLSNATVVTLQKMATTISLVNFTGADQNNANRQFNFTLSYANV
jgi:hypothetical protein